MRKAIVIVMMVGFLSSCKSNKVTSTNVDQKENSSTKDCPANNNCTLSVKPDTGLSLEKDDLGGLNLDFQKQPGMTSYHYIMAQNVDKKYMDGDYREEIAFQLPSDFDGKTISGKAVLETKITFGVFCYCKGKAGYYKVNEGTITKKGKLIIVEIPKIVDGQKLNSITLNL